MSIHRGHDNLALAIAIDIGRDRIAGTRTEIHRPQHLRFAIVVRHRVELAMTRAEKEILFPVAVDVAGEDVAARCLHVDVPAG